jgi:hypothetical protein
MKPFLLLFILTSFASAQTVVVSDNFDSYPSGAPLAATSPLWITWTGAPSEEASVSSAQSSSAPNSVYIVGNNGPTDIMFTFPAVYTSGIYELTMKMFIVTGSGAYFNLQASNIPAVDWMLEVYFTNSGTGTINAGGSAAAIISYTPNAWNDIKVNVDLTNDLARIYINNTLFHTWPWTSGSDGLGAPLSWGGLNLFATSSSPSGAEFYVDDIVLTDLTTTGMDNNPFTELSLYPNPSHGNFELAFYSDINTEAFLRIYNALGENIMETVQYVSAGKNRFRPQCMLPEGIYYLQLTSESYALTQKIVIDR